MLGEDPKAAVESFRLPALAADVTGAAEDPIDGERRIRNLCGSSADASMLEGYAVELEERSETGSAANRRRDLEQPMLIVSAQDR